MKSFVAVPPPCFWGLAPVKGGGDGYENYGNLLKKSRIKKTYPEYLKEKEHYFYIDNNNNEWCFTEINGTKENYYFKCSTHICKGFGKLKRNKNELNNENQFTLTKQYTIPYEEHNYKVKRIFFLNQKTK